MIIVTGGAGFIGSNLIKKLNQRNENKIIIVDDLNHFNKIKNLSNLDFCDYIDIKEFYNNVSSYKKDIKAIFHQGACADTTVTDIKYVMRLNFEFSKLLLNLATNNECPFIYASSASVYGNGDRGFEEKRENENPLNFYAFSKFMFDQYIRQKLENTKHQIVGLRYFNVYGPGETHKENMASTAFQFYNQMKNNKIIRLFKGTEGYEDGEQLRDFIYVNDIISINLWFYENQHISGIFNAGTGEERSFNSLANAIMKEFNFGKIEYIDFPEHLKGKYQNFTKSDNTKLLNSGFNKKFFTLENGVQDYLKILDR